MAPRDPLTPVAEGAAPVAVVSAPDGPAAAIEALAELGYETWTATPRSRLSVDPQAVVVESLEIDGRCLARIRRFRRAYPAARIVCTATSRRGRVEEALSAGANAVVSETTAATLRLAFAAAHAGYVLLPQDPGAPTPPATAVLSSRERQILVLVTLGLSNGEIARKLHIAVSTVKSHVSSAFAKLGVRTRREATSLILSDQRLAAGILALPGERERLTLLRGIGGRE